MRGKLGERPACVLPRARRCEGVGVPRGIELEEQVGTEAQEGDQPLVDAAGVRPRDPVVQVGLDLVVGKPVGERGGHLVGHAAIALPVACGEDRPAGRHPVLSQSTVEDQLVRGCSDGRHRRSEFVQEQNAVRAVPLGIRQDRGNRPDDVPALTKWNPAQVGGLHLGEPDIDERSIVPCGDLRDDLRLSDARRPPKHDRRVRTRCCRGEFPFEDGRHLRRAHEGKSEARQGLELS